MRRQAFLRAVAAIAAGAAVGDPLVEVLQRAASGDAPGRVGGVEVEQINHSIDLFGSWQDLHGGGACKDAISGQVQWATSLLSAQASEKVKDDLLRSVGFLADVAGWGSFDAGDHDAARHYFELAVSCAEHANDWGLRANVLSDMARQAIYVGRPDDGLSLVELAQVRQDRQTPTVRAMLETVRARCLAKVGLPDEAYGAVLRAEDHFSGRKPEDDPPWITYFDEPEFAADAGHALVDGARAGRHVDPARERLQRSIDGYLPARARAFSIAKLAILELESGEADRGMSLATQAWEAELPLKSRRAHDDLTEIGLALDHRIDMPAAAELRTRISHSLRSI